MKPKKKDSAAKAGKVEKLAVIGTGLMGQGIATVSAPLCSTILMKDVSLEAAAKGMDGVWKDLDRLAETGKISKFERDARYGKLVPCADYSNFKNTGIAIEAVFEDLSLKKKILKDTEDATGEDAIFASNTSAIPIQSIAEGASRPENVVGMHYFSPVPRMPLLEIIAAKKTAPWVTERALSFGRLQGKKCIVVRDGPAFYTTRILMFMIEQAMRLLEEGADFHEVDDAMKKFGFPVGSVTLVDEIGVDVIAHVSEEVGPIWKRRGITPSQGFKKLLDAGMLGRKAGKGFYRYDVPKVEDRRQINGEALPVIGAAEKKSFTVDEIQNRVGLTMVSEAIYCLEEGIISSPADGDLGATLGLGFPFNTGGPFKYADARGISEILKIYEELHERLGAAFRPPDLLADMVKAGRKFY